MNGAKIRGAPGLPGQASRRSKKEGTMNKNYSRAKILAAVIIFLGVLSADKRPDSPHSLARRGTITSSTAQIWRENQLMVSVSHRLEMLDAEGDNKNLSALQGSRNRQSSQELQIQGSAMLSLGLPRVEPSSTPRESAVEAPDLPQIITVQPLPGSTAQPIIKLSGPGGELVSDPFDALTRVNDYFGLYETVKLTNLRDSASLQKGWSMYMLGFNISVRPGIQTRRDYQAVVKYQVELVDVYGKVEPVDKHGKAELVDKYGELKEPEERLRVYAVYPQRYTLNYAEDMTDLSSIKLSGQASLPGSPGATTLPVKVGAGYGKNYQEKFQQIQRYPLISGYIDGNDSFGWVFNPRPRVVTSWLNTPKVANEMVDDNFPVTAVVMVKDNNYHSDFWVYETSETKILGYFGLQRDRNSYNSQGQWLEKKEREIVKKEAKDTAYRPDILGTLWRNYAEYERDILCNPASAYEGSGKFLAEFVHTLEAYQDWQKNGAKFKIASLQEQYDKYLNQGNTPLPCDKAEKSDTREKNAEIMSELLAQANVKPAEPKAGSEDGESVYRKALAQSWSKLHEYFLWREGLPPSDFKLKVTFSAQWLPKPGPGLILPCAPITLDGGTWQQPLPRKMPRAINGMIGVWPDHAPGNQESWVSIKGQGFVNDMEVLVGTQRVDPKDIKIVTNDLVLVKVPQYPAQPKGFNEPQKVKIKLYNGGEGMGSCEDCFIYVPPFKETGKEPAIEINLPDQHVSSGNYVRVQANKPVFKSLESVEIGAAQVKKENIEFLDDYKLVRFKLPEQSFKGYEKALDVTLVFKEKVEGLPARYLLAEKLTQKGANCE